MAAHSQAAVMDIEMIDKNGNDSVAIRTPSPRTNAFSAGVGDDAPTAVKLAAHDVIHDTADGGVLSSQSSILAQQSGDSEPTMSQNSSHLCTVDELNELPMDVSGSHDAGSLPRGSSEEQQSSQPSEPVTALHYDFATGRATWFADLNDTGDTDGIPVDAIQQALIPERTISPVNVVGRYITGENINPMGEPEYFGFEIVSGPFRSNCLFLAKFPNDFDFVLPGFKGGKNPMYKMKVHLFENPSATFDELRGYITEPELLTYKALESGEKKRLMAGGVVNILRAP